MTSTLGWSLDFLLDYSSNFVAAERISATSHDLAKTIKEFEHRGEPLVVESYNNHPKWPHEMFTLDYFMEHGVSNGVCSLCGAKSPISYSALLNFKK